MYVSMSFCFVQIGMLGVWDYGFFSYDVQDIYSLGLGEREGECLVSKWLDEDGEERRLVVFSFFVYFQ